MELYKEHYTTRQVKKLKWNSIKWSTTKASEIFASPKTRSQRKKFNKYTRLHIERPHKIWRYKGLIEYIHNER